MNTHSLPAKVLLEDGTLFQGFSAGAIGTATGELCFNTSMTGYQEVFTDPSYYGQVLVATNVHVGNYGTKNSDQESEKVQISALICRNFSQHHSRKMSDMSLQDYFIDQNIVAITGVDTREIVRLVRSKGAMNCIVSSENKTDQELMEMLKAVPTMQGLELASKVSTKEAFIQGDVNSNKRVAVLDYGAKKNIIQSLVKRGCLVKVFPYNASFEEIAAFKPLGVLLSNGPGDPATLGNEVKVIKALIDANYLIFGICLGHQLLAQAAGLSTYKMHHGHRGSNHPVKNLITGHCEITSQNHGFAVSELGPTDQEKVEVTHINLNDNTVEGIRIKGKRAYSVQHHPEACPGPHDSDYMFDDFVNNLN